MRPHYLAFVCCLLFGCSENSPAVKEEPFTVVVLPDTQNAVDFNRQKAEGFAIDSAEIFIGQMQHISERAISNGGSVVFVASVGDVWQHVTSSADPEHTARGIVAEPGTTSRHVQPDGVLNFELPKAIEGYEILDDAGIPFGVAPGNHDYDAWWTVAGSEPGPRGRSPSHVGGLDNFRVAFGSNTDFYRNKDWYVGSFDGGANSAQVFSAGGYQFLHLALEMQPGDDVLAWAGSVAAEYPGLPTIVTTHDYLNPRGERMHNGGLDLATVDPTNHNSAEDLWRDFISATDQIFMVLCGHQDGQALRVDKNDFGHDVYQILSDYQDRGQAGLDAGQPLGRTGSISGIGDGWFREMIFYVNGDNARVDIRTFSSHYRNYSNDLETYAAWYKEHEKPDMSDEQFLDADQYTISLTDFRARFGAPARD